MTTEIVTKASREGVAEGDSIFSKSINRRSKAAILRSFAKQSSHDIRNMRGPGAQNDSAFSTASSGERRMRPRVVRRTTLHVWARCLP